MPTAQNSVLINKQLQKLGFGTLKDPSLFDQMAMVIRDHTHFRRLLMAVEAEQRHIAYEALAPKLRFKAKPLEDYVIESRTLAEQNQLPHYDPKTLAVTEWKPQEMFTKYDDVICELCEAGEAVTGDGKWHHYGTPEQCICATSRFHPEGYSVAPNHPKKKDLDPNCTCLSLTKPRSENPCPVHEPYEYEAWQVEHQRYAKVAEEVIDRDLRESEATQQCVLVCTRCTFEQIFRLKKRSALKKVSSEYGWTFNLAGDKAYCRACSKLYSGN